MHKFYYTLLNYLGHWKSILICSSSSYIGIYHKLMMEQFDINKKIILSVISGLILWLIGIIMTPLLASSGSLFGQKVAAFMYFFYKPVCHQISDRSFWLDGYVLTVCVRCFSFYLGGFLVSFVYFFKDRIKMWKMTSYALCILPAFLDFLLEKMNFYMNISGLRLLTGLLLGIAIFQLFLVSLSLKIAKNCDSTSRCEKLL